MSYTFVLIHSPLVGPLSWTPAAEELRKRGHAAIVPDLTGALASGPPFWPRIAEIVQETAAHSAFDHPLILAGHSGAGALLPAIREKLGQPVQSYLFVDARLPKDQASFFDDAPVELAEEVRSLARAGWLPAWSDWFGADAMKELLSDAALREAFVTSLHPVPLALLEERVPVFSGWPDAACAYLQLSAAYEEENQAARRSGWPTARLNAGHLHLLENPAETVEAMLELLDPA